MAEVGIEPLSVGDQMKITESLLAKPLVRNDTWYLIDQRWFKSFKWYIGLDIAWDGSGVGQHHPGPIDNSSLLKDDDPTDIRNHLVDGLDYVLVPEELWNNLFRWYGMVADQKPIQRKVVEYGLFVKSCKVEVYLSQLRLVKDFDFDVEFLHKFSKADTIGHIADTMRKLFNIPEQVDMRLWSCYSTNTYDELKLKSTFQDEGLYMDQIIVAETCLSDGTWRKQSKNPTIMGEVAHHFVKPGTHKNLVVSETPLPSKSSSSLKLLESGSETKSSRSSDDVNKFADSSMMDRVGVLHMSHEDNASASSKSTKYTNDSDACCSYSQAQVITPGLCGLHNIGNTCFMNSVIQCMSNCPPITEYFVDDRYIKELNTVNPLGRRGEIATAFGELIKLMWSGKYNVTVPHKFKIQVGKFAPQFSGNNQNDCHELLTFLLDGLHEDLNRIKNKPYGELNDSNDCPDEVLAAEAWENHRKRNDSIIIDNFHGLLKSTVECPECSKVSVTFDPFCYLSLPLPMKRERCIQVMLFPFDARKKPQSYNVMVPKSGCIQDLLLALSQLCGLSYAELLVTEVAKHHFHRFFSSTDTLDSIDSKDYIVVFEVPKLESHVNIPVCLWQLNSKQTFNFSQLFGHPMILTLPETCCTFDDLYAAILVKLCRYITIPQENGSTWWSQISMCDDGRYTTWQHLMHILPRRLFTLHVINASTASVVYKFKGDETEVQMPFPETIGRKYLAAQWTLQNLNQYFNMQVVSDIERHDSTRQSESDKVQLSDCLSLYTMREKLGGDDAWYCPSCKKHQRATKKIDLWNLPSILIMHLKRFSFTRYSRDKINTYVEYPIKDLDMSNFVINHNHPPARYKLIGVCNHYGVLGSGHYTALALNKLTQKWYNFDDNSVSPIYTELVVSNSAYVLFYQRCDESASVTPSQPIG